MERFAGFAEDYEREVLIFHQMAQGGYPGPIPTTGCNLPFSGDAPPTLVRVQFSEFLSEEQKRERARALNAACQARHKAKKKQLAAAMVRSLVG